MPGRAFDHRHVFIDPEPDAAASFAERERLFKLPRSSWADYDTNLISAGGGVKSKTSTDPQPNLLAIRIQPDWLTSWDFAQRMSR